MRRLASALLLAAAGSAFSASAEPASARFADRIIAVGILAKVPSVVFRVSGAFQAIDQSNGELMAVAEGRDYKVEAEAGADGKARLLFGPHLLGGAARLLPGRGDEFVTIGDRKYRGNLVFRPHADGTLTVIDELGIEEYLFGVLPHEMSPDWPAEALKAQAVVSRSFALASLGRHEEAGFDLTDDDRSQLYTGLTTESERVRAAVRATSGEVLNFAGRSFQPYFHSTCGGHTSDSSEVWGGAKAKPLRGVKDAWCKRSPHYRWDAYLPKEDILAGLNRNGMPAGRIDDIREGARGAGGFLKDLRLKTDGSWERVGANQFRLWMGVQQLKSVRLDSVRRLRKGFEFSGRGYGHGVGLCQWGARGQAEAGRGYREILSFYFPGASVGRAP
ncbi:MAG: SpoIID/LytB domain-containing protein [Elusimicrobia bacterium]|nr:SpoIID/LytB domain-containing protein [Elusimicrobiota bacterium]